MNAGRRSSGLSVAIAGAIAVAWGGCSSDTSGAKALRAVHMGMGGKAVASILGKPATYNTGPDPNSPVCWLWLAHPNQRGAASRFKVYRYKVCFRGGVVVYKQLLD